MSAPDWESRSWSDVQLLGMQWQQGGRDLALHLRLPGDETRWVLAEWASNLSVSLSHGVEHGGYPMTWSGSVKRDGTGWKVLLDFASVGHLSFDCAALAEGK